MQRRSCKVSDFSNSPIETCNLNNTIAAQCARHLRRLPTTAPLCMRATRTTKENSGTPVRNINRLSEYMGSQPDSLPYSTLSSSTRHPWRVDRLRSEVM